MSRSLKKGPYINVSLEKKILAMNESGKKNVVKTWARASVISPDFVGHTVAVHKFTSLRNYFLALSIIYLFESFLGARVLRPLAYNPLRERGCPPLWRPSPPPIG